MRRRCGIQRATWGDREIWELAEPLLYLGRQIKASSGGAGKYRGGCGFESLRMVWNAKDWTMFFIGNGHISSDWADGRLSGGLGLPLRGARHRAYTTP